MNRWLKCRCYCNHGHEMCPCCWHQQTDQSSERHPHRLLTLRVMETNLTVLRFKFVRASRWWKVEGILFVILFVCWVECRVLCAVRVVEAVGRRTDGPLKLGQHASPIFLTPFLCRNNNKYTFKTFVPKFTVETRVSPIFELFEFIEGRRANPKNLLRLFCWAPWMRYFPRQNLDLAIT